MAHKEEPTAPRSVVVYRRNLRNLGDLWSDPSKHVPWLANARPVDIFDGMDRSREALKAADVVVVGGGGMWSYCDTRIEQLLGTLRAGQSRPLLVWWGAGNGRSETPPDYLDQFDLVGMRDWQFRDRRWWVPCASCLHEQLPVVLERPPKHDVVVYEARGNRVEQYLGPMPDLPSLQNDAMTTSMAQAIDFLASARRVVTRSYHGAYWATLLGREVVVPFPPARKYLGLRRQPRYAQSLDEALDGRPADPDPSAGLLEEARERNLKFAASMWEKLCLS